MRQKIIFWVLAVVVSLAAMVYQRMTGPTYEKRYEITYGNKEYKFALPRSHGQDSDCPVEIELPEPFEGQIVWRRFPTEDPWNTFTLERSGDTLLGSLPQQPAAGKLEYHLVLNAGGNPIDLGESENVVIRFRDPVPAWAMITHVMLMVLTVIWSTATIFLALANIPTYIRHAGITLILLFLGAFIFGPIVQKYSFGQFWTGWPIGEDLTDNKVLFALFPFLVTWILRKKSYSRWLAIASALIMLAIYLIPHSMNGSELDLETGQVVTGSLLFLLGIRKR